MTLTLNDLDDTLSDERHLGFGYATASFLTTSLRERLDRNVVFVANESALTKEELFLWSNSKYGRWLVDTGSITRATVRDYLSRKIIDELRLEGDSSWHSS